MKFMNGKVLEVEGEPAGVEKIDCREFAKALRAWEERRGLRSPRGSFGWRFQGKKKGAA
jgi:hypothetical protein